MKWFKKETAQDQFKLTAEHNHVPNYRYTTERIEWRYMSFVYPPFYEGLLTYQVKKPYLITDCVCNICGVKYLLEEEVPEKFKKYIEGAKEPLLKGTGQPAR